MHVRQVLATSLFTSLFIVLCGCAAPSVTEEASPAVVTEETGPLEGAWRLTGLVEVAADGARTSFTPQESLFLFRGANYSMAYAVGEERSPAYAELFTPTDQESVARFSALTVNAGTYDVAGSTATLTPGRRGIVKSCGSPF